MTELTTSVKVRNKIRHKDEMTINILACIVVGLVAFISLVPFYVIIVSSFRSEASIIAKGHSLIPQDLSTTAYEYIFRTKILDFYKGVEIN